MFNKLIPPFLKKLDHYLLINYPFLWASKVHFIAFYCGILNILIALFWLFYPLRLNNCPDMKYVYYGLFTTFTLPFLICWGYYQKRSKALPDPENNIFSGLKKYFIYIICMIMISGPPLISYMTIYVRVKKQLTFEELKKDTFLMILYKTLGRTAVKEELNYLNELFILNYTQNSLKLEINSATSFKHLGRTFIERNGDDIINYYNNFDFTYENIKKELQSFLIKYCPADDLPTMQKTIDNFSNFNNLPPSPTAYYTLETDLSYWVSKIKQNLTNIQFSYDFITSQGSEDVTLQLIIAMLIITFIFILRHTNLWYTLICLLFCIIVLYIRVLLEIDWDEIAGLSFLLKGLVFFPLYLPLIFTIIVSMKRRLSYKIISLSLLFITLPFLVLIFTLFTTRIYITTHLYSIPLLLIFNIIYIPFMVRIINKINALPKKR